MSGACSECGRLDSPFGYGPPFTPTLFWRCGEHRLEGRVTTAPRIANTQPAPPPPMARSLTPYWDVVASWLPVKRQMGPNLTAFADKWGRARREAAIRWSRVHNNRWRGTDEEAMAMDIAGMRCEAMGWSYFEKLLQWHYYVERDVRNLPDLGRLVDVKGVTTEVRGEPTIICPKKKNGSKPPLEWAYFLIDGRDHPFYTLIGWKWGHEFLTDDHWDETLPRAAWRGVPPYHPPSELLALAREGKL